MAELNLSTGKSGGKHAVKKMPVRVDLTAMVDLAFLLITFFMITTTLQKPKAMPVVMPVPGPEGPVPETRTMSLCLGKNNQLVWYMGIPGKPLTLPKQIGYGRALNTTITEMAKQIFKSSGKGIIVVVKPSDHSIYANLVETLDDLRITNVPTYAIAKILPGDVELLKQRGIY
jgi:biopolymer transport protein ExbD